jgi:8-oxo-dGTP pyrophosphatase MutT (NUDIX family)
VATHHDCLERSLQVGHITASAWVVNPAGTHIVLVHHRKLDRWLQPGGHADGCPEVESVARAEVREETGLDDLSLVPPVPFDLDIHPIPTHGATPAHDHYDIRYAFRLQSSQPLVVSDESHQVKWAPIDNLEAFDPDPSILRLRRKWLSRPG